MTLIELLKDTTLTGKSKLTLPDGSTCHPFHGVLPQLEVTPLGNIKANVRINIPGVTEGSVNMRVLLPAAQFDVQKGGEAIAQINNGPFPIDSYVVNIPMRLSDNGAYLYCTNEMWLEYKKQQKLSIEPLFYIRYGEPSNALVADQNGIITTSRGKNSLQCETVVKGRGTSGWVITKGSQPSFRDSVYKDYNKAFYSLLTSLTEAPYRSNKSTIVPRLKAYNFHNIATMLATYFKKHAELSKRSVSYNLNYSGSVMDPIYEDDTLASIRALVVPFVKQTPKRVTLPTVTYVKLPD